MSQSRKPADVTPPPCPCCGKPYVVLWTEHHSVFVCPDSPEAQQAKR